MISSQKKKCKKLLPKNYNLMLTEIEGNSNIDTARTNIIVNNTYPKEGKNGSQNSLVIRFSKIFFGN